MKHEMPDFQEVFGQMLPVAQEFQKLFFQQLEQAMAVGALGGNPFVSCFQQPESGEEPAFNTFFGQCPGVGNGAFNLASLGVIQPFFTSTWSAMQQAFSQVPFDELTRLQTEYAEEVSKLMNTAVAAATTPGEEEKTNAVSLTPWFEGDRRFASQAWHDQGPFEATAAMYALNAKYTQRLLDLVPADLPEKKQVDYALNQFVSAASPTNYFATNPEAQQKMLETNGQSLTRSMENLLADMVKGQISLTDEDAFEVGVNVATTPGSVVFENDFFQLIQYSPTTEKVGQRPMLFVPPFINKYYILDLQPTNSMVAYLVGQGHTLFLMSWKNAQEESSHFTWDDYVENGVIQAIDTACSISKQKTINVMGFCVGGTLLATALTTLAGRKQNKVDSVTFLATLLDFTDGGALGVFMTEEQVRAREETIGQGGIMPGKDLAGAFSSLRPNDLIWHYVVANYLKGEKPPAFDLLYWNGDSTNLPGPMFSWYLRNTYLENNLAKPKCAQVCDVPVDFSQISCPAYILATREDHIVPWASAYETTRLIDSELRFVLGASGHIAGVVNPVSKNRRSFWLNDQLPESPQAWWNSAQEQPGSWWADWAEWLEPRKGKLVKAPAKLGNAQFKPIEPAPGRYVKEKA